MKGVGLPSFHPAHAHRTIAAPLRLLHLIPTALQKIQEENNLLPSELAAVLVSALEPCVEVLVLVLVLAQRAIVESYGAVMAASMLVKVSPDYLMCVEPLLKVRVTQTFSS